MSNVIIIMILLLYLCRVIYEMFEAFRTMV
jgi:hypothetical protein